MIAPSGEQIEIAHGDQRAVVVEVGGGLREYTLDGRDVLDGYGPDEMSSSGRGQVLIPWPNRIQDGLYSFDGQDHQLPLDDVEEQDAIHGLVRWGSWIAGDRAENRVVMEHALHPQPGYPFSLALSVEYAALGRRPAGTDDRHQPRAAALPVRERQPPLPRARRAPRGFADASRARRARCCARTSAASRSSRLPVEGTDYDFRRPRAIGATVLDHAFTDLERGEDGRARVELRTPRPGDGASRSGSTRRIRT